MPTRTILQNWHFRRVRNAFASELKRWADWKANGFYEDSGYNNPDGTRARWRSSDSVARREAEHYEAMCDLVPQLLELIRSEQ